MTDDRDAARRNDEMTEARIRDWLAESAPNRLPASVRDSLQAVTSRPASRHASFGFARFDRAIQVAAAIGILAVVGSTVAVWSLTRQPPAVGTSSPPPQTSAPATTAQLTLGTPVSLGAFWTAPNLSVGSDGSVLVTGPNSIADGQPGASRTCIGPASELIDPSGARREEANWGGWFDAVTSTAPFVAIATNTNCTRQLLRSEDGKTWQPLAGELPADLAGNVALTADWLARPAGSTPGSVAVWSDAGVRTVNVGSGDPAWSGVEQPAEAYVSSDTHDEYGVVSGRLVKFSWSNGGAGYAPTGLRLPSGWSPGAGLTGPVFRNKLIFRMPGDGTIVGAPIDGSGAPATVFTGFSPDGYAVNAAYAAYAALYGIRDGKLVVAASADGTHWTSATLDAELPAQQSKIHAVLAAAPGRIVVAVGTLSGEQLYSIPVTLPSSSETATPAPSPTAAVTPSAVPWRQAVLPAEESSGDAFNVYGLPNQSGFVAFDPLGAGGIEVLRSTDGTSWTRVGTIAEAGSVGAFTTDGKRFVAAVTPVTQDAAGNAGIWYSDDLKTWSNATLYGLSQQSVTRKVAYFAGVGYVALVENAFDLSGSIWFSTDGASWRVASGVGNVHPFDVIARGGRLLLYATAASGASGPRVSIWTSSDGLTWAAATNAAAPTDGPVTIVSRSDGSLIAFDTGASGSTGPVTAWTSSDGVRWSEAATTDLPRPSGGAGLRFDSVGGRLLAVTASGSSLAGWQSSDGLKWHPFGMPGTSGLGTIVAAGIDDDGTVLVVSGSATTAASGQAAHAQRFVFTTGVGRLP